MKRTFLLIPLLLLLASPADAGFPLAMKDDRGVVVRLAAAPLRIVSLAPSLTEVVFLLGMEKTLKGATRYCNFPPAASKIPRIGGISDPDVERVVSASPDLVLCTTDGNPKEKVAVLEGMGIRCFAVSPQNLAGIFSTVERVAALLGVTEEGRRKAGILRARTERVSRASASPKPRILFVVSTNPVIAAGRGTFMDELVLLSGGTNAAANFATRYPRLSTEDLLSASPDLILVASMAGVDRFPPEVSRWKEVPAFRDGEVHQIDGDIVTRPGPRMVDALEKVSARVDGWRHARSPMRKR